MLLVLQGLGNPQGLILQGMGGSAGATLSATISESVSISVAANAIVTSSSLYAVEAMNGTATSSALASFGVAQVDSGAALDWSAIPALLTAIVAESGALDDSEASAIAQLADAAETGNLADEWTQFGGPLLTMLETLSTVDQRDALGALSVWLTERGVLREVARTSLVWEGEQIPPAVWRIMRRKPPRLGHPVEHHGPPRLGH